MFNFLQPHGLLPSRLLCPPLSQICSNSCPLSQWCQPIMSSSLTAFFSCPPSFSPSTSFPLSWLFASGGQSMWDSATATVLPMNIQDWFLLGLTSLISFLSKDSQSLLQHHNLKVSILWHSAFFMVQLSCPYMTTGKAIALTIWTSVSKVVSLFFNMLYRFVGFYIIQQVSTECVKDLRNPSVDFKSASSELSPRSAPSQLCVLGKVNNLPSSLSFCSIQWR